MNYNVKRDVFKNKRIVVVTFLLFALGFSCSPKVKQKTQDSPETYADIKLVGAMKNVMWKGELGGRIFLDTISNKENLYGLGPLSYLKGELLIIDGKSYVSKVSSDSSMTIEKRFDVSAPFFVYGKVEEWDKTELPIEVKTIKELEQYIDKETTDFKRPFAFKLIGEVTNAIIHIQNLPKGTKVSSPKEAHTGQTKYKIGNEQVEIIGFYSTKHKGIFTHHDSNVHMHLITANEKKMGHLDEVRFKQMKLYLPKK